MPNKLTKRMKMIRDQIIDKPYSAEEAFSFLKTNSKTKFIESIDVACMLGVDPKNSSQMVRGAAILPHGSGRSVRVAVFAQGAQAQAAKEAGAEIVGFKDLAETIKQQTDRGEKLDFDVLIATPDAMGLVGQLGRVLGPRGLMPNPKVGTVTPDPAQAVKNAKGGQVAFRTEKGGIVHCTVGKANFDVSALKENLEKLLIEIKRLKPSTSKGVYLKKVVVSSTMGPGLMLDLGSLKV